jgi:phosphoribosyl 1,2-cyclic phosphodiesterase
VSLAVPAHDPIMFDLGTGARYFGMACPADRPFHGTCLLTHLHMDHTQGLPFFGPLLRHGGVLDLYGPAQEDGRTVREVFDGMIYPPLFPVGIDAFPGTLRCHDLGDQEFMIGDIRVMSRFIPHVGPTLGYRVEWNGISVAYLSDHQQPYDGGMGVSDGALQLVSGADLLIHDAQYTPEEFPAKYNWGHCTVDYAVWLAGHAGAKRLMLFHHDPSRSDDAVDELQRMAAKVGEESGVEVLAAHEGLVLELF